MVSMNMWPQALVAIFLLIGIVGAFLSHGKMPTEPFDRKKALIITAWFALVLGAGGFWTQR